MHLNSAMLVVLWARELLGVEVNGAPVWIHQSCLLNEENEEKVLDLGAILGPRFRKDVHSHKPALWGILGVGLSDSFRGSFQNLSKVQQDVCTAMQQATTGLGVFGLSKYASLWWEHASGNQWSPILLNCVNRGQFPHSGCLLAVLYHHFCGYTLWILWRSDHLLMILLSRGEFSSDTSRPPQD